MLAAFLAAYMSTISTHLNWGASYAINDFYRRFLRRQASERHHLRASQVATILLMLVAAGVTYYLETIRGAWQLLLMVGAGTGTVYLLRWYWWRVNAWSELSAMVAAFVTSVTLNYGKPFSGTEQVLFAKNMVATTVVVTGVWLAVTFVTRPSRFGWGPIATQATDVQPGSSARHNALAWILGCALVYCSLFATGKLLLGYWTSGLALLIVAVASGVLLYLHFARRGWESFG
jgi:Na+/proline symporter